MQVQYLLISTQKTYLTQGLSYIFIISYIYIIAFCNYSHFVSLYNEKIYLTRTLQLIHYHFEFIWNKAPQTFEYSVTLNISAQYIGYCSNIFSSEIVFTVQDPSRLVSKLQDPTLKDRPVVNQRQTILIRKHQHRKIVVLFLKARILSLQDVVFRSMFFLILAALHV